MDTKKYLKWYQKLAYGSGDMGSNFMYALVSSFLLLYLTTVAGMNSSIIGTLMMISRFFDGVTDVLFGNLIDKTHSKMGKARPWMFWSAFPLAICEILLFTMPQATGILQYGYFFVVYTLLNAVFYTANNIAYSSLTALVTKNPSERVQLGSIRFIFALITNIAVSAATVGLATALGGGAAGWRMVAIIYALLLLLFNMVTVFSVKELPQEGKDEKAGSQKSKVKFIESFRLLLRNRYFLLILAYYIVYYGISGLTQGIGVFFCTFFLGDANIFGLLTMALMVPIVLGLVITPILVSKFGIFKVNTYGMIFSLISSVPMVIFGYMKMVPLLLVFSALKGLGMSPMLGTINAVIADAATYTFKKDGVHMDGAMYSCSSMGIKVGTGIGTAICGWLLDAGGFINDAVVQPASAINMINALYLIIPLGLSVVMTLIVANLNVEKGIRKLEGEKVQ